MSLSQSATTPADNGQPRNITAEEIRALDRLVSQGGKPHCPACKKPLEVKRRTGTEGSVFHSYRCTTKGCSLPPKTLQVPWYLVPVLAVRKRSVKLILTAVGGISLAGIVAFITSLFHPATTNNGATAVITPRSAPYTVRGTTLVYDFKDWLPAGTAERPSIVHADRFDTIVRSTTNQNDPYRSVAATSGDRLLAESPTHRHSMRFAETSEADPRFRAELKHIYEETIPASEFSPGATTPVHVNYTYVNAFKDQPSQWLGSRPTYPTEELTFVVLLPKDRPGKRCEPFIKPISEGARKFDEGPFPVVSEDRLKIVWHVRNPTPNVGYAIQFEW